MRARLQSVNGLARETLKVVGLTRDLAESYAPMTITVSYAGQDGTPKPSDDYQLDKGRRALEDRVRNHLSGATGTGRQRFKQA